MAKCTLRRAQARINPSCTMSCTKSWQLFAGYLKACPEMQPSFLQGATRRFAVLVLSNGKTYWNQPLGRFCGRVIPLLRRVLKRPAAPFEVNQAERRVLPVVICKSFLTTWGHEIRYGTMSGHLRQKFLGGFGTHERFLNNFSMINTFNLIAHSSFTPSHKGANCARILFCYHQKFFFKIRQKRYERSQGR